MTKTMKSLPPASRLNELLAYDEVTGIITWKVTRGRSAKAGQEAGSVNKKSGYRLIMIDGQNYTAARIAWALCYGADPYPAEVDHENRRRTDNRIDNLRLATRAEQLDNRGNKGERPIKITYPDGQVDTVKSITAAASTLNRSVRRIQAILRREPGQGESLRDGTRICYEM
jgi:hypothetical protein